MIRILLLALFMTVCAGLATSQPGEGTADAETWDPFVVHKESVACYTLVDQPRAFAGQILIQFNENESACTVAITNPYDWSDEFAQKWNKAVRDNEPMQELWESMPAPIHCWKLDDASMSAKHAGSVAWDRELETVLVGSITGSLRHERTVRKKFDPAKPEWWPSQYALSQSGRNEYGNVMPGQEALYYVSSGKRSESKFDVWGEIPRYEGPGKFVIRTKGVDDEKVAVLTLDIQGIHSGLSAFVSMDGQWAVMLATTENKFWILDLRKAWPVLRDDDLTETDRKEPANDGD